MSASPQILPVLPGSSESLPGMGVKKAINHTDSELSGQFGPLLGDAFAALSTPTRGNAGLAAVEDSLNELLQTLPGGGKLLPLMQQALDEAAALGVDPQEVIDEVVDRLDTLELRPELTPVEQVADVLKQLIRELPAMQSAATGTVPEGTVVSARDALPAQPVASSPAPTQEAGEGDTLPVTPQNAPAKAAAVLKAVPDISTDFEQSVRRSEQLISQRIEVAESNSLNYKGLDQALSRLQQQSQSSEPRPADLASMLVAFKRLAAEPRGAGSEAAPRGESFASALSGIATSVPGSPSPTAPLPSTSVNTPFGQAGWDQAVGERIQWMVSQRIQGAEVKLNPANLGPMEIRVHVQNDQASVFFTAHHGNVREALEGALPRLREMFEASGVELVNVDVSDQSFAEQRAMQDEGRSGWGIAAGQGTPDGAPEILMETPLNQMAGGGATLDLFV